MQVQCSLAKKTLKEPTKSSYKKCNFRFSENRIHDPGDLLGHSSDRATYKCHW